MERKTIAFIGCGNMGGAILAKMVASDWDAKDIIVIDHNKEKLEELRREYGVTAYSEAGSWLSQVDAVLLAVKPQQLAGVLDGCKQWLEEALVISIAAGVRIEDLRSMIGHNRICRAMPNTPMKIGKGVCGLYSTPEADEDHRFIVKVFAACGELIWCDKESMLESVTAVSGSGPAYVFRFIEALDEAALSYGFNPAQARRLAISTVLGSAELAKASSDSPAELRAKVTSKGGTTYEALKVMDEHDFMGIMKEAMDACRKRAEELGNEFHDKLEAQRASEK